VSARIALFFCQFFLDSNQCERCGRSPPRRLWAAPFLRDSASCFIVGVFEIQSAAHPTRRTIQCLQVFAGTDRFLAKPRLASRRPNVHADECSNTNRGKHQARLAIGADSATCQQPSDCFNVPKKRSMRAFCQGEPALMR